MGCNANAQVRTACEIAALDHEIRNDAVEAAALKAKALLSGAQRTEVLHASSHALDSICTWLCDAQTSAAMASPLVLHRGRTGCAPTDAGGFDT